MVSTCSSRIGGGRGSKARRKMLRGKSHRRKMSRGKARRKTSRGKARRKMSRGKARRKTSRVNSNAGDIRGVWRTVRNRFNKGPRARRLKSYTKKENARLTAKYAAERKRMERAERREYTERGTFGNKSNHLGRYLHGDAVSPSGKDID